MKRKLAIVALAGLFVAGGLLTSSALAAAPANTALPTITGTLEQGKTVTATNGTWSGSPTSFSYQWQRCSSSGTSCVDIVGATTKSRTLTAADVDHTVRVAVTATNADGKASATSKTTGVVSASTPPHNTTRPSISGTAQVGEELTADHGTWTGRVRS